ncbi:MAG: apolipoprotein N-acyltransferase [Pseudomonadota bacterium]
MTSRARWPFAAATGLGAFAALGQAPHDFPITLLLALLAICALFQNCKSTREAAIIGWAFGFGYFAHALQWIVSPFLVDAARHGWMAPFAVVLLAAGLALFWGAAFWAARRLRLHGTWTLVLTWPAAELIRAYIFTGFPWAMPAQAMIENLWGQSLGLVGPYALNLTMVAWAASLSTVAASRRQQIAQGALAALGLALTVLPPMVPPVELTANWVRLVQPNVAQKDKWDPEQIPVFFDRHLMLTASPPLEDGEPPDLIVWSETAIPWRLENAGGVLKEIAQAAGGTPVALGAQRSEAGSFYNSMAVLDAQGGLQQVYDKHHLVPFGEYVPLARWLNRLGVFGLAQQLPTGYARGPGPKLLDFGPLGRALPLICYEVVFPHDVNAAPARPDFLLQITNDAWFGKGAGPKQHLAQARMRAIEQGLPLARSANTGISAMIDPYGRVTAMLPLNTMGVLDAPLPAPREATFYSRTGDIPMTFLLCIGCVAAAFGAWQGRAVND